MVSPGVASIGVVVMRGGKDACCHARIPAGGTDHQLLEIKLVAPPELALGRICWWALSSSEASGR